MAYESDNPQMDNLINNMDSDEVPYKRSRPSAGMGPTLPLSRLPKQFWRVVVSDSEGKLRTYDRASKTYADYKHALNALDGFSRQGIKAEIWTTGPVEWTRT